MVAWGWEMKEGGITRGHGGTFGGDVHVYCVDCGNSFTCMYICQKRIKLCTLNMYGLLYVNYTSIENFKLKSLKY